ncbi:hypothetical protein VNO77_08156 [Canavalia gladiata]|uniref:Uncharacterized protein n=1 Tax=Canavalia gladiata TaxID=3824 RepID=A0AAN9M8C5_CANGL
MSAENAKLSLSFFHRPVRLFLSSHGRKPVSEIAATQRERKQQQTHIYIILYIDTSIVTVNSRWPSGFRKPYSYGCLGSWHLVPYFEGRRKNLCCSLSHKDPTHSTVVRETKKLRKKLIRT